MPDACKPPQFPQFLLELGKNNGERKLTTSSARSHDFFVPDSFLYHSPTQPRRLVFFVRSCSILCIDLSLSFCFLVLLACSSHPIARNGRPSRRGCLRHGEFFREEERRYCPQHYCVVGSQPGGGGAARPVTVHQRDGLLRSAKQRKEGYN